MNSLLPNLSGVVEAGCDEAGRGCLAGPVFAAAVILPIDFSHPLLNDSKKLSHTKRMTLIDDIKKYSLGWAVASVDAATIDKINILKASIMAMHLSLDKLTTEFKHIIVDGNKFLPYKNINHTTVVKGDGKYLSIAAASILAKEYRDDYIIKLHDEFPEYNWKKNKAYPTKEHRSAIEKYGITPYHRRSFKLTDDQLKLNF
ncbi:MAG: ribonuclease HII [Bacteroidales bacterium]|jgi:ribonuclease HII|nr:ribonuclease HII [Bacteroidales bacterium]